MMAGTLLLLARRGLGGPLHECLERQPWQHDAVAGRRRRGCARAEAQACRAHRWTPVWHPSICNDLASVLRRSHAASACRRRSRGRSVDRPDALAAGLHGRPHEHGAAGGDGDVRAQRAGLPHACRRAIRSRPRSRSITRSPHGLRDGLRRRVLPEAFVNTTTVQERKRAGARVPPQPARLARRDAGDGQLHRDDGRVRANAGIDVGASFSYAEGWRRHSALRILRRSGRSVERRRSSSDYLSEPGATSRTLGCDRDDRPLSAIAPDWWDYTTLDRDLIDEAARLTPRDLTRLSRPGFTVVLYDTLEEFYLAEALEYIDAWRQSTDDNPVGICGPIGPTEQLPLVARIVNALDLDVRSGHFWGMDEWFDAVDRTRSRRSIIRSASSAPIASCASIASSRRLRMPDAHLHFPKADTTRLPEVVGRRRPLRGDAGRAGRREALGVQRSAAANRQIQGRAAVAAEYRKLTTRVVDLHPLTIAQNARTSGGGNVAAVPTKAITVGPVETWKAEKVSIWHAGTHDNPFGQRLTALMISKADRRHRRCRCRCSPIIRTCSSTISAAGLGRVRWRCTEASSYQLPASWLPAPSVRSYPKNKLEAGSRKLEADKRQYITNAHNVSSVATSRY